MPRTRSELIYIAAVLVLMVLLIIAAKNLPKGR